MTYVSKSDFTSLHFYTIKIMDMQDTKSYYKNQKEFHIFVASTFSDLKQFKENGDKTSFNELLLKTLPQVNK